VSSNTFKDTNAKTQKQAQYSLRHINCVTLESCNPEQGPSVLTEAQVNIQYDPKRKKALFW